MHPTITLCSRLAFATGTDESKLASLAGAGSLSLEFGLLTHLTGNLTYADVRGVPTGVYVGNSNRGCLLRSSPTRR